MKEKTNNTPEISSEAVVTSHISHDLRNSVLIVSVVMNVFVFTAWVALQVTSQYDASLAAFLFTR